MSKNILIVGCGIVGSAIKEIEEEAGNNVYIKEVDQSLGTETKYDVMHICIPYIDGLFETTTVDYILTYNPTLTIINSSIPVGTTEKIHLQVNNNTGKTINHIVHSPIRGTHPHMYKGIKEFVKYIGGDEESGELAIKHLESIGIEPYYSGVPKTTELMKLLDTAYYGLSILFAKEVQKYCKYLKLDFYKVYTHPNKTYNLGYKNLGMEHVVRPILYPPEGKISGHCVSQNFELLPDSTLKGILKRINEEN